MEPAGDRVLVAGRPTYLFHARQRGDTANLESTDVVFGAVLNGDGTARTVAAPAVNHGRVAAVAATALGPGRWRVIFAESDSVAADADVVPAYWHGIYDGAHWSEIQQLPPPPAVSLRYFNSSRVLQRGDTVVWAGLARTGPHSQGVVVFERVGATWSHMIPTTPFASSVELIHTPQHGFILGVFRHQWMVGFQLPNAVENPEPKNAVYFSTRQSGWQQQRMIRLPVKPIFAPDALDAAGEMVTVTTVAARPSATPSFQLQAVVAPTLNSDELTMIADSNATLHFATVVAPQGEMMWVSRHAAATADSTDQGELRLIQRSGGTAKVLWRNLNPYLGPFSATAYSASDVLIVGPELDRAHELLVSLIIRVRVECTPQTKRP